MISAALIGDEDQLTTNMDGDQWIGIHDFREIMRQPISAAEAVAEPAFENNTSAGEPTTECRPATPSPTGGSPPPPSLPTHAPTVGVGARDRIVVLGRRAAGKTVYLTKLYASMWGSLDHSSMEAVSGMTHRDIMLLVEGLNQGEWPAATLDNQQMAFDVRYRGMKRLMVSMDYSGEVFRRAFVHDGGDSSPETRELFEHLDNAGGAILLLDPGMVYEHAHDMEAAIDDDFGMVQAVKRIRDWPGGDQIPIVLVLTKCDKYPDILMEEGGATGFVKKHWPAMVRTLRRFPVFMISAVQTDHAEDGSASPKSDSRAVNVKSPLKYILREMLRMDTERRQEQALAAEQQERQSRQQQAAKQARNSKIRWMCVILMMVIIWIMIMSFLLRDRIFN